MVFVNINMDLAIPCRSHESAPSSYPGDKGAVKWSVTLLLLWNVGFFQEFRVRFTELQVARFAGFVYPFDTAQTSDGTRIFLAQTPSYGDLSHRLSNLLGNLFNTSDNLGIVLVLSRSDRVVQVMVGLFSERRAIAPWSRQSTTSER